MNVMDPPTKVVQTADYLFLNDPKSMFRFILMGVPHHVLQRIKYLRIHFDFPYDAQNPLHQTYLVGLGIILRILPGIGDLVLLWDGAPSSVFEGTTFLLDILTSTVEVDESTFAFLEQQTGLQVLELTRWNTRAYHAFPLPQWSLPHLHEVGLSPDAVMRVVPRRPIQSVDLRIPTPTGAKPYNWDYIMYCISQSDRIVDDLAIATLDSFSVGILAAIAKHLPRLRYLYIRVKARSKKQDIFRRDEWSQHLAQLPYLEEIKLEVDQTTRLSVPGGRLDPPIIPNIDYILSWAASPRLKAVHVGIYRGDALAYWER